MSNLWPRSHTLVNFETYQLNDLIVGHVCCLISCFQDLRAKKTASGRSRAVLFIQDLSGGPLLFRTHNNLQQERAGTLPPPGADRYFTPTPQGQGTTSLNRRGWNGKVALSVCAKGVGGRGTCWPNSSCTEWVSSNQAEALLLTNYFLKDSVWYIHCSNCRRLLLWVVLEFWPELKPGAPGRALILKNPENDIGELSKLS